MTDLTGDNLAGWFVGRVVETQDDVPKIDLANDYDWRHRFAGNIYSLVEKLSVVVGEVFPEAKVGWRRTKKSGRYMLVVDDGESVWTQYVILRDNIATFPTAVFWGESTDVSRRILRHIARIVAGRLT